MEGSLNYLIGLMAGILVSVLIIALWGHADG